ncbi:YggS family pyridoxal phosphate-dependent enzyme [archaeon]|jgi:PLP dependent protein|nr:YggS family pyridoxal phosphate-dependent enzyme [archaeon]MBT4648528.1 YggS family pyridoxal phosphate-dependent enzyme [archaeon]MBT6821347.1 YggS family pyridoxal phosphate-dependent enzyme [archaeon]MBT7391970.1 YggS family pyridoxal phosphate-dependent enzyme [archaeon]
MIKKNLEKIFEKLPSNVKLVAVSKRKSIDEIKKAIELGVKIIAENRIQESIEKYDMLINYFKEKNVKYQFIGHLQTNKVKNAVKIFDLIQTIDSIKLVEEINKRAKQIDKVQDILIQVNIAKQEQKYGLFSDEVEKFIEQIKHFENINIKGFMCMAPFFKEAEDTRVYFKMMKEIFDKYDYEILSMGMTNDYEVAIEEGSNMVRIGIAIFGERK